MVWVLIIFIALAMIGWLWAIKLFHQKAESLSINTTIQEENQRLEARKQELEDQCAQETQKLEVLRGTVQTQNGVLKQLTLTAEAQKQSAQQQAQQEHDLAVAALKQDYDRAVLDFENKKKRQAEELSNHLAVNQLEIQKQEKRIQALKDMEAAYIEARKKEQETREQLDYRRLAIAQSDLEDIKSLRIVQRQLNRPDAIDKLIWELYYKPAYDALMPRLSDKSTICGIYKITNITTGQAYIGQSVNIKERFRQHIKAGISSTPATNKLYQAMKQYGVEDFTFMILEEVPREKLNEQEVFWIDFFKTKETGLNKTIGGS